MSLLAAVLLPFLVYPALAYHLGPYPDVGRVLDGYVGPYSCDYYRRILGQGLSGAGAYPGPRYGSLLGGDFLDLTANADVISRYPGGNYLYAGYPRTVDVAKENFVRGNVFGATEVGIRDEVTIRPSDLRLPFPRYYCNYYPFSVLSYCRSPCHDTVPPIATDLDLTYGRQFAFGGGAAFGGGVAFGGGAALGGGAAFGDGAGIAPPAVGGYAGDDFFFRR